MTERPTLLAVCTVPPWPTHDGYALRVANLLRELSNHWAITLVAPEADPVPAYIAAHVPVRLTGRGFTYPWRFDQTPLRAAVERAVRDHRPGRALVWPGAEAIWFGRKDLPPAVADIIDCNPLEFWRGFARYRDLRRRYWAGREILVSTWNARRIGQSFVSTVCVGEADAACQRRIGGASPVHVIPNGVIVPDGDPHAGEAAAPTLCFTGSLDFQPNIEAVHFAADVVWPHVRAAMPEARFIIAGRSPGPDIIALGDRPRIEIFPNVAEMNTVIGEAWVCIAPMHSGVGIKNKILEAWARGRPTVLTPLASNGLIVPPDHATLVREGALEMADEIVRLFRDPESRYALGLSARENVRQYFTWAGAAARMDALLKASVS